ncbi:type II secretion system protein N [Pseudoalteromonas tunicata]|uniref:type II secretion system protein N n=1 Tax=Pseudoalteromonas tunicata TaxID=314281 RepID=UPI00273DDBE1|nr:type II secretion system protein N [Pseudoalteromonas tunicata]MDP5213273.1 type II secretion system protein N [Pseudoalteromonas tunicata]
MKKTAILTGLFLVCWVFFIICLMPAYVVGTLAKPYLPAQLKLGEITGSIWQGQIAQLAFEQTHIQKLAWDITPTSLLLGQLNAKVTFGQAKDVAQLSGKGVVGYGIFSGALTLNNTQVRLPLADMITALKLPLPVSVKGQLIADISQYQLGAPYCNTLAGDLLTKDVSVQGFSGWFTVESLIGELNCRDGAVTLNVEPDNELGLEIDASVQGPNQMKLAGFIKPAASMPKDVHNAVKFFGRPDEQGRYTLRF